MFPADAFQTGDVGQIARSTPQRASRGRSKIARETGPVREQLYKSLSEDKNPKIMLAVLKAIGLEMAVKRRGA